MKKIKIEHSFSKEDFKVWIKTSEKYPKMLLKFFNKK